MSENINHRQIQWFPGHMARTLRLISENRKNVDVVLQLLDARIPRSSLNPELEKATQGKPHLYLLNKADLADEAVTARWKAYFKAKGDGCLALSSKQRTGMQEVKAAISAELSALLEKRAQRGMAGCAHPRNGGGYSQCGKIYFYQQLYGQRPRKGGRTSRASRAASNG